METIPQPNPTNQQTPPTIPSITTHQTPPLVTFTNFSPIKLTQDTYPIWLPQVVPHLKGGNLYGYVDGTHKCPLETITTITDGVETTSSNPVYLHWYMQDQLILGAITSALSSKMISHVTRCTTSMEAWTTLKNLFSAQSKARSMQVHFQLNTLKKGNSSIADYYQKFQALTDTLSSIGQPLTDVQMQAFLLGGLGYEYDPFVTSITTRIEPLSVEEIYGHLLSYEMRLEQHHNSIDLSIAGANVADRSYPSRGGRGGRHNFREF